MRALLYLTVDRIEEKSNITWMLICWGYFHLRTCLLCTINLGMFTICSKPYEILQVYCHGRFRDYDRSGWEDRLCNLLFHHAVSRYCVLLYRQNVVFVLPILMGRGMIFGVQRDGTPEPPVVTHKQIIPLCPTPSSSPFQIQTADHKRNLTGFAVALVS